MKFNELPIFKKPNKITIIDSERDTRVPYERIKSYDDKEYERFIREWVLSLDIKYQVRGFGGAGDKGRDVIAKDSEGNYFYYQCKHYDHPLMPSDIISEFGKLVFYTYNKTIPKPKEYYILAPHDIGPALNDLIDNPSKINSELIEKWDTSCKSKIKSTAVSLTDELKEYIQSFDFSIIKTKSMMEVVEEHKKTAFYAFRFGGGLTIKRDRKINIPEKLNQIENVYVSKFLAAVSEKEGVNINTVEQLKKLKPDYLNLLQKHRERFYSAENLKLFAIENLLSEEYYQDLCNDIYYSIYEFLYKDYNSGMDRLLEVMTHVVKVDLSHNILSKYDLVYPQDRQGICHQLANERDEIKWTIKN